MQSVGRGNMNLYWVTTDDHHEDWFIVASSSEEASKYHEDMEGYNPGDAVAEKILSIPEDIDAETGWASEELLIAVGAKFIVNEQSRIVEIEGREFYEGILDAVMNEINDDLFEERGDKRLNKTKKQESESIDEIITQHAVFKMMDNDIIPCSCGDYRKIIQKNEPESLVTQCSKCNSQESFNIYDLAILGGALLKHAIADANNNEFKAPNVSNEQVFQMIESIQNHEAWVNDEDKGQSLRKKLKIIKGGQTE